MAQTVENTTTDEVEAPESAEATEATPVEQPDVPQEVSGLPTHLVISEVASAKDFLTEKLEDGDEISIDLSELVKVDTAGYQLLSAFEEECRRRDVEVHWENAPESVLEGARSLGLDLTLEDA